MTANDTLGFNGFNPICGAEMHNRLYTMKYTYTRSEFQSNDVLKSDASIHCDNRKYLFSILLHDQKDHNWSSCGNRSIEFNDCK